MQGAPAAAPNVRRRNDKGRRTWSTREEDVLLLGLKDIIANGWKSDNGFRVGYLQALEAFLLKKLPGNTIKAMPHINSKIHTWKKQYGSLFSMLSKSGIGWNPTTKMIEASDEAWESYVKVDIGAKIMRNKSWPYYEDWCEVFGRDRATGLEAESYSDAVNEVMQELDMNGSNAIEDTEMLFFVNDASNSDVCASQPATSSSTKKSSGKKRKPDATSDPLCDILDAFCDRTDARLGEIAKRMGHEYDMACARKEVWAVVESFEELSLKEKLLVTRLLVASPDDMMVWPTLPLHAREEMIRMKLAGHM